MQFIGAEGSGIPLLVKITSESEVGGRAGGAGWGRGASGSEANDLGKGTDLTPPKMGFCDMYIRWKFP